MNRAQNNLDSAAAFRRGALIVFLTGVLTIVLAVLMVAYSGGSPRPHTFPNKAGLKSAMVWLELIADGAEARLVLGPADSAAGQTLRRKLDRANRVDFGFMFAYSLLNAGIIMFLYLGNRLRSGAASPFGRAWYVNFGLFLALVMLIGDAVETYSMFAVTAAADPGTLGTVPVLYISTRIKWAALFLSCGLFGAGTAGYFGFKPGLLFGMVYCVAAVFGLAGVFSLELRSALEVGAGLMSLGWLCSFLHASFVWFRKPVAAA